MTQIRSEDSEGLNTPASDARIAWAASRVTAAVVSVAIGVICAWMFWIVYTFLEGRGWFDVVVRTAIEEFILTAALFAFLLLVWATLAPPWLFGALSAATKKLLTPVLKMILVQGFSPLFSGLPLVGLAHWLRRAQ